MGKVPLLPDLLQYFICGGRGQRLARMKYPDAMLLTKRSRAAERTHGKLLPRALHMQGVAGLEMQFAAQPPPPLEVVLQCHQNLPHRDGRARDRAEAAR
jgi:hypothetical protein